MSAYSPQPVRGHAKAASCPVPWIVRVQFADSFRPHSVPVRGNARNRERPLMSSFDPASVRQAVAEFTPRRPQRFQDLSAAREVIVELRQKRASYRSIADLLTQHCLPTSKTAIAAFCHEVLGETIRPRRKSNRKRPLPLPLTNGDISATVPVITQPSPQPACAGDALDPNESETPAPRTRGPRIAQVRKLNPPTP